MNRLLVILLSIGIVCSGMWCASYVISSHTDCNTDSAFSVMCVETLEHGSIISGAILVLFSVAIGGAILSIFKYLLKNLVAYTALVRLYLRQNLHFDKQPTRLQIMFARGILHPRNP